MMDRLDDSFGKQGPAKLAYGDGDYRVVQQGAYVVCAVTGKHIPLSELRYWSVDRQEPYVDAAASLKRHLEVLGRGQPDEGEA